MPTARRAVQRVDRGRAARPGKGSTQDVRGDRRRRRGSCRGSARTGGSRRLRMSTETSRSTSVMSAPTASLLFPTLTAAQIARIASRGVIRPITCGEVLIESGQRNVPFFVVKAGEIEVIRPSGLGDVLVAVFMRTDLPAISA